jgi:hypothetical protein
VTSAEAGRFVAAGHRVAGSGPFDQLQIADGSRVAVAASSAWEARLARMRLPASVEYSYTCTVSSRLRRSSA